jgi:cell envelope-related function transcriptional attenuator common domain
MSAYNRIPKKKHGFVFHWWYILILVVLLMVSGTLSIYIYVNSHLHEKTKYANTWSDAISQANSSPNSAVSDSSSTSSDDEEGLTALDADSFIKVDTKDYPIIKVKRKDPNIQNILIIGIDGGVEGGVGVNRGDCILIASINTKNNTLKLSSLLRDTKTYFPNTDSFHKLNAAYSYGGPGLLIDVINYAYKLDVQKYIQVDFSGFQKIIDTVGGVDINLSDSEVNYLGIGTNGATYHLDGATSLNYARARYLDSDFNRTQRQRNVVVSIYNKFKDASLMVKTSTANSCLGYIKTNIPTTELLGILLDFGSKMSSNIQTIEIPTEDDGMYTTEKSPVWYWDLDWSQEVPRLQNFIYGS